MRKINHLTHFPWGLLCGIPCTYTVAIVITWWRVCMSYWELYNPCMLIHAWTVQLNILHLLSFHAKHTLQLMQWRPATYLRQPQYMHPSDQYLHPAFITRFIMDHMGIVINMLFYNIHWLKLSYKLLPAGLVMLRHCTHVQYFSEP